jgi:hypothetical protein
MWRWSASLPNILLNPFEINMLPVSLTRRTGPKHYVVALGEPTVFSNFCPPHSLTLRPARKCASAWDFAASGCLCFARGFSYATTQSTWSAWTSARRKPEAPALEQHHRNAKAAAAASERTNETASRSFTRATPWPRRRPVRRPGRARWRDRCARLPGTRREPGRVRPWRARAGLG